MSFLRITPSAHITSLGGGATAFSTGPSGLWSNPALISNVKDRSFQFTHTEWIEGIQQEYVAFSTPSSIGHLGLAVNIFDSGDIELRGNYPSDSPEGTYSIKNVAIAMSYATTTVKDIAIGVTFKKLYEKISMENASGYAFDFGLHVPTPIEGLTVGGAARNYGNMGKLKNERTELPSDISVGCVYRTLLPGLELPCIILGDYLTPKYGDSGARLGFQVEPSKNVALRIGYRNDSDIQNVSFGFGFIHEIFSADVSYTPMQEGFDNALRLTLGVRGF